MPRCSALHHHCPKLQETNSQCKKAIPGKAAPPLQASTEKGSLSSMLAGSQAAILCRDVLQAGPAFIAPSHKKVGAGRDGTGASLASSADALWLPFSAVWVSLALMI